MLSMTDTATNEILQAPLGLLLQMVEGGKLSVTEISIADITKSYLDRLDKYSNANPELMSEFLHLGCRLLYIKSLALFPQGDPQEQQDEIDKLNIELDEYRTFQQIASQLHSQQTSHSWERRSATRLEYSDLPTPNIKIGQLQKVLAEALNRNSPILARGNITSQISQKSIEIKLLDKLKHGELLLADVLNSAQNRLEIIVTFLSILELIKRHQIVATESGQFHAIMLGVNRA
jgi:segregation and condensation protein A